MSNLSNQGRECQCGHHWDNHWPSFSVEPESHSDLPLTCYLCACVAFCAQPEPFPHDTTPPFGEHDD